MKRLEVINEDTLELSPFVGVLKFRAVRFRGSQYKLNEGVMLPVSYVIDKQESCKLYRDMDINCMLMGLGYRALQLFNWVALTIEKDRDWVQINEDLFCKRAYRDWETYKDRKSTRLNSSHSGESRMPSSA